MSGLALSIRGIDQANGFVKTGMIEEGCQMLYSSLIGHFLKKGDLKFSFSLFGLIYGRKREMIMSLVQKKKMIMSRTSHCLAVYMESYGT